ncbi:DUF2069 domain-containing protein [Aliiglaciecola sp. CAU 1673]|uniref:DUF2069 domain-containing protein n=1 Tax=Aliiglaciecola sp. CAU 1673 TaxID=3032595 RepID=UPI0023DA8B0D|nr:DUF2069 domain-containing protein [Aliiglaciecola sp. CAU 1673]MDF2177563.1 DUF2069 domain-containing protein [Aliiglaciecola sp. CAU 1673]
MAPLTKFLRFLALFSYLGLVIWVPLWHFLLSEGIGYSVTFIALIYVLPLLLPLRGIVTGKPYTHAWANFVLMLYLMHGLTSIYAVEGERWYAALEILLSSLAFIGCTFYARLRGRELGLGLKKLKESES